MVGVSYKRVPCLAVGYSKTWEMHFKWEPFCLVGSYRATYQSKKLLQIVTMMCVMMIVMMMMCVCLCVCVCVFVCVCVCVCTFTVKASSIWISWTARKQINDVVLKNFISYAKSLRPYF